MVVSSGWRRCLACLVLFSRQSCTAILGFSLSCLVRIGARARYDRDRPPSARSRMLGLPRARWMAAARASGTAGGIKRKCEFGSWSEERRSTRCLVARQADDDWRIGECLGKERLGCAPLWIFSLKHVDTSRSTILTLILSTLLVRTLPTQGRSL